MCHYPSHEVFATFSHKGINRSYSKKVSLLSILETRKPMIGADHVEKCMTVSKNSLNKHHYDTYLSFQFSFDDVFTIFFNKFYWKKPPKLTKIEILAKINLKCLPKIEILYIYGFHASWIHRGCCILLGTSSLDFKQGNFRDILLSMRSVYGHSTDSYQCGIDKTKNWVNHYVIVTKHAVCEF